MNLAAPRRQPGWQTGVLAGGLAVALFLLCENIRRHAFLTDDSFIAFRYARNLAHGHGLVFNPGGERVEGYSSLLWVLMLAALDALGWVPERAAGWLSILATLTLWALVVAYCMRRRAAWGGALWSLLPAFGLAICRSFGVWATGGLETRVFELAVVAGLLRLADERAARRQGSPARSIAPSLLAAACLLRPEGLLVAGTAFALQLHADRSGPSPTRVEQVRRWWPVLAAVAAESLFRWFYYHALLPNTWYAKVGGEFFWAAGARYVAAFALEYGLLAWIPLLLFAMRGRRRRESGFAIRLMTLVPLPLLLFVAAVGGDHFEYRPLDLVLPLGFVVLNAGAVAHSSNGRGALAAGLSSGLVLAGLVLIPHASEQGLPSEYHTGFPGAALSSVEGAAYLDPGRDPVLRLPVLDLFARAHRTLVRELTSRLIAVRAEEHRLFLAVVEEEGRALSELIERNQLPRDTHIAIDCVGVVPYVTDLPTLDRLGLTDARIARQPRHGTLLAHWRFAAREDAAGRGVELWAVDRVKLVCPIGSRPLLRALGTPPERDPRFIAAVGGDRYLLCELPQGLEATRRRIPHLTFESLDDSLVRTRLMRRLVSVWHDSLAVHPTDVALALDLGELLMTLGVYDQARDGYRLLLAQGVRTPRLLERLALCEAAMGNMEAASNWLGLARDEAIRTGDRGFLEELRRSAGRPGH